MEVCVDSLASAAAALNGGAARLEVCSALALGGLTPTLGLFKRIKSLRDAKKVEGQERLAPVKLFCLIRVREGDFLYTQDELEVMKADMCALADAGADGFVFGCLTAEGEVDEDACAALLKECKDRKLQSTFHRAADAAKDLTRTLRRVADLGFDRVLTSGGAASAAGGVAAIKEAVEVLVGTDTSILPGGGINESNLLAILTETGAHEFHASARVAVDSGMRYRNDDCAMGSATAASGEYTLMVTSEDRVRRMMEICRGLP